MSERSAIETVLAEKLVALGDGPFANIMRRIQAELADALVDALASERLLDDLFPADTGKEMQ